MHISENLLEPVNWTLQKGEFYGKLYINKAILNTKQNKK